jgi:hypothetical protein
MVGGRQEAEGLEGGVMSKQFRECNLNQLVLLSSLQD